MTRRRGASLAWSVSLLGPRYDVREPPPLAGRERPGLYAAHGIAHAGLVALVVHHELPGTAHPLLVHRVAHQRLDRDGHRLICSVRDDEPDPLLAPVALGVGLDLALVLVKRGALGRTSIEAGFSRLDEVLWRLGHGLLGRLRSLVFLFLYHYLLSRFLVQDRQDPGDILPDLFELSRILQLPGCVLEAQVEELAPCGGEALLELLDVQLSHFGYLHCCPPPRARKRVFMGSFWAARCMASRASASSTPLISNITRPGLTTATYASGLPLPLPILVSAGFLVTGLCGKILIQTFPPRRIFLVIAIRAASIWRLVIQAGSRACSPYSPNCTSVPPLALPRILPRWGFLYLSFLGTSMVYRLIASGCSSCTPWLIQTLTPICPIWVLASLKP